MKLLLDTHVLLWAASDPEKLGPSGRERLLDEANQLFFSSASLWEVVIKSGLGRDDFRVDAERLRRLLVANGYQELPILGDHALAVARLPDLHRDPFDRILIAQARTEGRHGPGHSRCKGGRVRRRGRAPLSRPRPLPLRPPDRGAGAGLPPFPLHRPAGQEV